MKIEKVENHATVTESGTGTEGKVFDELTWTN